MKHRYKRLHHQENAKISKINATWMKFVDSYIPKNKKSYYGKDKYDQLLLDEIRRVILSLNNIAGFLYNFNVTNDLYGILFNDFDFTMSVMESVHNPVVASSFLTAFLSQGYNRYNHANNFKSIDLYIRLHALISEELAILFIPDEYFVTISGIEKLLDITTKNAYKILTHVLHDTKIIEDDDWFNKLLGLLYKFGHLNIAKSGIWLYNTVYEESGYDDDYGGTIEFRSHFLYRGLSQFCVYDWHMYPRFVFETTKSTCYIKNKFLELHKYKQYETLFLLNCMFFDHIPHLILEYLIEPFHMGRFNDDSD